MAEDLINSIVDRPAVSKQIADTIVDLQALQKQLVEDANAAVQLNNAIGASRSTADFERRANAAAIAATRLAEAQTRAATAVQRLNEADARAQIAEQRLEQQALRTSAAQDRATTSQERQTTSTDRAAQAAENARRPYQQLQTDLERLRTEARDIGTLFGTQSQQFTQAARGVNALDSQIRTIDRTLGQNQRNVGNYASAFGTAFSAIRQAAYILPGIGIAGIFNLIGEGIGNLITALKGGESVFQLNNSIIEKANGLYAEQAIKIKLVVGELQGSNVSSERRNELIENLNKLSPKYFGNIKTEQDLIKNLKSDYDKYNEALMLTARIQAGQDLLTQKYKEQLQLKLQLATADKKDQDSQKSFVTQLLKNAGAIASVGSSAATDATSKDLAKGITQRRIVALGQDINSLTAIVLQDQQKLQKNGGDISGEQLKLQQKIENASIDTSKELIKREIETNNVILNDTKKSYADRMSALRTITVQQDQLILLSEKQQNNNILNSDIEKTKIRESTTSALFANGREFEKKQKELNEAELTDSIKLSQAEIDVKKSAAKRIIDNEQIAYYTRLNAVDKFQNLSIAAIKKTSELEIKDAGDNAIKLKTIAVQQADALNQIRVDAQADRKKIVTETLAQIYKTEKQDLDEQKNNEKLALSQTGLSLDKRLEIIEDFYNKSIDIVNFSIMDMRNVTDRNNTDLQIAEKATNNARLSLQLDYKDSINKILEDEYNKQIAGASKHDKDLLEAQKKASSDKIKEILEGAEDTELSLSEQRSKGLISERRYQQDLLNVQHQANLDVLDIQIKDLKNLIVLKKDAGQNVADDQDKLNTLQRNRDKENSQYRQRQNKTIEEQRKDAAEAEIKLAQETAQVIQAIVDASYQARIDALQKQSDAIGEQADREKAAVERSLLTSQEKADKEALIDANAKAQQEQITKEINKEKTKQAEFDRAITIAGIIEQTALAVAKVIGEAGLFGIPLTAIVAAIGAAQIATVLATPLPKFADGTENHPGGWSIYGEAGTELVKEPGKAAYLTEGTTVGNLAAGTKIISNDDLISAMLNPGKSSWIDNQLNLSEMLQENKVNTNRIVKALEVKQKDTYKTGIRDGARRKEWLNRNGIN